MPAAAKKATAKKTTSRSGGASKKATASAVSKFEEQFEKSMGVNIGKSKPIKPKIVSTGSMTLDYATAVGGVPTGRVIEVWGPEHAGKTTLAIIIATMFQKMFPDKRIAWVDMEQTFDEEWAVSLGLDMSKVWFYTPETAEDVADAVKRFVYSDLCSFVVLDSIGGMISRIEIEKEADEATVGKVPGIVTRMVKAAAPRCNKNGTTVCVINQVRAQIGGYGADEGTGGGWALKHVTTMKFKVRKAGGDGTGHTFKRAGDEKPIPVGHKIAVKVEKNKMGPYGQVAEIWLHNVATPTYGPIGFDMPAEVFNIAKRLKMFGSGHGGRYDVEGEMIVGEPKVVEHLRQHPEVVQSLRSKILDGRAHLVNEEVDETPEEETDALGMADMVDA